MKNTLSKVLILLKRKGFPILERIYRADYRNIITLAYLFTLPIIPLVYFGFNYERVAILKYRIDYPISYENPFLLGGIILLAILSIPIFSALLESFEEGDYEASLVFILILLMMVFSVGVSYVFYDGEKVVKTEVQNFEEGSIEIVGDNVVYLRHSEAKSQEISLSTKSGETIFSNPYKSEELSEGIRIKNGLPEKTFLKHDQIRVKVKTTESNNDVAVIKVKDRKLVAERKVKSFLP